MRKNLPLGLQLSPLSGAAWEQFRQGMKGQDNLPYRHLYRVACLAHPSKDFEFEIIVRESNRETGASKRRGKVIWAIICGRLTEPRYVGPGRTDLWYEKWHEKMLARAFEHIYLEARAEIEARMSNHESEVQTEVKALSDECQALDFDKFAFDSEWAERESGHSAIFDHMQVEDWAFWLQWLRIWARFMREPKLLGPAINPFCLVAGGEKGLTLCEGSTAFWLYRNDADWYERCLGDLGDCVYMFCFNHRLMPPVGSPAFYEALSNDFARNWLTYYEAYFGGDK